MWATRIVEAHPTSLGCILRDETETLEAAENLCNSIVNHIRYMQSLERERKRKLLGDAAVGRKRKKSDNFSRAQNFALCPNRDLPSELPQGETKQTQEAKRIVLVEMNSQGQRELAAISKIMSETYVTIRMDINKKMRIEALLKRWPFIGMVMNFLSCTLTAHLTCFVLIPQSMFYLQYPVLQSHYEYLMNCSVQDDVGFELNYSSLEKFFESVSHEKSKGKQKAKEKAARIKEDIRLIRCLGDNCTNSHRFIFTLRCAMAVMDVKLESLFVHFEVNLVCQFTHHFYSFR